MNINPIFLTAEGVNPMLNFWHWILIGIWPDPM
jgi:hypothetical protein